MHLRVFYLHLYFITSALFTSCVSLSARVISEIFLRRYAADILRMYLDACLGISGTGLSLRQSLGDRMVCPRQSKDCFCCNQMCWYSAEMDQPLHFLKVKISCTYSTRPTLEDGLG